VFGWIKAQAGLAKVKLRRCAKVEAAFTFAVAALQPDPHPQTAGGKAA
jgi:hypothetical protein